MILYIYISSIKHNTKGVKTKDQYNAKISNKSTISIQNTPVKREIKNTETEQ